METIVVTCPTFHDDRSWLKDAASWNNSLISAASETSQDPIGPCLQLLPIGESFKQASIAALSAVLESGLKARKERNDIRSTGMTLEGIYGRFHS